MEAEAIIKNIKSADSYDLLLSIDQLKRSQESKDAFYGFEEEEITFPPTYCFEGGTVDTYVWRKSTKKGVSVLKSCSIAM